MKVRNKLKQLMEEKDVKSVKELSYETGIYYGTLLNFYHERFDIFNADLVAKLCGFFNCKIDDLLVLEKERAS